VQQPSLQQQQTNQVPALNCQLRERIEKQEQPVQTLLLGLHEQALQQDQQQHRQQEKNKRSIGPDRRRTLPQSWQFAAAENVLSKASLAKARACMQKRGRWRQGEAVGVKGWQSATVRPLAPLAT